jgi:hypothetical protein
VINQGRRIHRRDDPTDFFDALIQRAALMAFSLAFAAISWFWRISN